jgi:hypothetical protein
MRKKVKEPSLPSLEEKIIIRFNRGDSVAEIAEELAVPTETVKYYAYDEAMKLKNMQKTCYKITEYIHDMIRIWEEYDREPERDIVNFIMNNLELFDIYQKILRLTKEDSTQIISTRDQAVRAMMFLSRPIANWMTENYETNSFVSGTINYLEAYTDCTNRKIVRELSGIGVVIHSMAPLGSFNRDAINMLGTEWIDPEAHDSFVDAVKDPTMKLVMEYREERDRELAKVIYEYDENKVLIDVFPLSKVELKLVPASWRKFQQDMSMP